MTLAADPALQRAQRTGMIFVLLSGVLWSTIGLGIRLIEEALVWQILLYRSFGLCLLLYGVIWLRTGRDPFRAIRGLGLSDVIGAFALIAAYSGAIYAIQVTSVANAMLLFASAPFMTAILGLAILGEQVRWQTWVAIGVALVGITIMVGGKLDEGAFIGNLAALGSAFGFAVFTVALRWGRKGEMLPCVFLSGLLAVPVMVGICLMLGLPLAIGVRDGGIALGMGIFQVGAGLVLYTLGSKHVPAAELALLSLAEALLGPVWVWLVLGEVPTRLTLIGGAALLWAVAFNALTGARRKRPAPRL